MLALIKNLLGFAANHLRLELAALLAAGTAAALNVARRQIKLGVNWSLHPIVVRLPWNIDRRPDARRERNRREHDLVSRLCIVDLFLVGVGGHRGRYRKTTNYVVQARHVSAYDEAVTCVGTIREASTLLGKIVRTGREHGFNIYHINLERSFGKGELFTNVFGAVMDDAFDAKQEHWTQEVAVPTDHLSFRIHFPASRKPIMIRALRLKGLRSSPMNMDATVTEGGEQACWAWEIERPALGDIFKIEWAW